MTGRRAPLAVARAGVTLASRALPRSTDRYRYSAEFLAELHALPPAGQLRYTAGVLSQTLALRAALGASTFLVEGDAMTSTTVHVPFWRCRIMRLHHWVVRNTDDGSLYQACARCGHVRLEAPAGPWICGS